MIRAVHPEALLLLPVALLLLRARLWPRPLLCGLRTLLLLAVLALLAQPFTAGQQDGRDVVVLLDRSRSMPPGAAAAEFVAEVQACLQPGDRLGLVAFGRKPVVEAPPSAAFRWPEFARAVDADGSDLAAAIDAGTLLVPPGRQGSLLLWSDGEHTGGDAEAAARAARRAGLRLDCVAVRRAVGGDVAVADLSAPGEVAIGAPFVLSAFVVADRPQPARWRLLCDGAEAGAGEADLHVGRNVLQCAQTLASPGVHAFALEVAAAQDAQPRNDRGLAAVRAVAPPRVLCVTPAGREDRLTRSLRAAGHLVDTVAPAAAPLRLDALDGCRCVVLENVPAQDLPAGALPALRAFVRDLGGGLLMTGGGASFGVGGYHRSEVEEVLPVTMEMREEQRRFALAMAIALDRSGSMQAPAGDGTKMDLADRGAATAVELLTRLDSVAVLAVDSAAHVVVPLQPAADKAAIAGRVRSIESSGGGIYVGAALEAAANQLAAAPQQRRHIVLFADAADAEEPGDYAAFVPKLAAGGITVSVIGLGRETDPDAALLQEIARLGQGRCQFVAEPGDLPRVFAQETIQVAKSAMIEEPAAVEVRPALRLLGGMPDAFPDVGGYSLAWLRPTAELDLVTRDAQKAPLLGTWQCGLGRGAAFLGEADGRYSGALATDGRYAEFFGTLVRWLGGGAEPGVWADFRRQGEVGVLSVEAGPAESALLDGARGVVVGPDGSARDVVFAREVPGRLTAEVALQQEGIHRAAVQVGGAAVRVPPVCLPYSPEFAPRLDPEDGERLLRRLAAATGGRLDPDAEAVASGERRARGRVDLGAAFALAAVLLLLAEIAVRRFDIRLLALARWCERGKARLRRRRRIAAAPAAPARPRGGEQPRPAAEPARDREGATLSALERARRRMQPPP